jgi:hypothetical protein
MVAQAALSHLGRQTTTAIEHLTYPFAAETDRSSRPLRTGALIP